MASTFDVVVPTALGACDNDDSSFLRMDANYLTNTEEVSRRDNLSFGLPSRAYDS